MFCCDCHPLLPPKVFLGFFQEDKTSAPDVFRSCSFIRGLSVSLKIWQGSDWFCMRLYFFINASFIIDTKGLYCVTKGNNFFSSLLVCFRSAAFLLWVLLLISRNVSFKLVWPASVHQPLFEIWNTSSEKFLCRILKASCLSNPF